MYVAQWMQSSWYRIKFSLITMASMVMLMMTIIMKVIMIVNDENNLQYDLWFNISRNIQGQEHAMEHSETSNTFCVGQRVGFLLDWTN